MALKKVKFILTMILFDVKQDKEDKVSFLVNHIL